MRKTIYLKILIMLAISTGAAAQREAESLVEVKSAETRQAEITEPATKPPEHRIQVLDHSYLGSCDRPSEAFRRRNLPAIDSDEKAWFEGNSEMTLLDVLGAPVATVYVTYVRDSTFSSFEEVESEVLSLLNSVILSPERRVRPHPYPDWAEFAIMKLEAKIQYSNGRTGLLQWSGHHLCYQDYDGTYWFFRWAKSFPRREKSVG